jgi:23S rRNA (uridine2552-2'-O)-methyltransferase
MSRRHWRQDQGQDRYFRKAKEEGYRSRSAYKLKQINDRFHVLRRGNAVLDLGAAPGGWSQVAAKIVGEAGTVIAVDLQPMDPIKGVEIITGDMLETEVQDQIRSLADGPLDVVLSDAAPSTTGIAIRDHALSIELAEMALLLAKELLHPGGDLVVKAFEGEFFPEYLQQTRQAFRAVKPHQPDASRDESREMYVIAQGLKG